MKMRSVLLSARVLGPITLGLLLAALGSIECGGSPGLTNRVDVEVTLELAAEAPEDPAGPPSLAVISIRGPGMGVVEQRFTVVPAEPLVFLFSDAVLGEERTVTAELRNDGGALLLRGLAKADFLRGELGRVTVVVQPLAETISVLTDVLSEGKVGEAFADTLIAIGNESRAAQSWAIASGFLPPGLELDPMTGAVGGTPERAGPFGFEVRVTAGEATATRRVELVILPDEATVSLIRIRPSILPIARVFDAYRTRLSATGGEPPHRFFLDPDEEPDPANGVGLPAGLVLELDGLIRGTAREVPFDQEIGTTRVTILAEDSSVPRKTGSKTYAITVISREFILDPRLR